jgi:hypothetical protein
MQILAEPDGDRELQYLRKEMNEAGEEREK